MKTSLFLIAALSLFCTSCVNQPVQTTQVVDDRPQITIVWNHDTVDADSAYLFVDGQNFGPVSNFKYPTHSTHILIGEHFIEIKSNRQVIYSKQDYFGENQSYQLEVH